MTSYAEARAAQIAADNAFAARLAELDEAGQLTTHDLGEACPAGLWHEGDCPDEYVDDENVDEYVVHAPGAACPAGPQHLGPCPG
jgi:prolyl-tRNA editing enzyme YbaK/EbsC (Cys-tRNA(Pro) deacylase)